MPTSSLVGSSTFRLAPPVSSDRQWGQWLSDLHAITVDFDAVRPTINLLAPLVWADANGYRVVVPAGFVSDGASIPQFAWSIVGAPLGGRYVRASVVHDYDLFRHRHGLPGAERSSSTVHKRFYNGMRAAGTSYLQGNLFYRCVQLGSARW